MNYNYKLTDTHCREGHKLRKTLAGKMSCPTCRELRLTVTPYQKMVRVLRSAGYTLEHAKKTAKLILK